MSNIVEFPKKFTTRRNKYALQALVSKEDDGTFSAMVAISRVSSEEQASEMANKMFVYVNEDIQRIISKD